MNNEQLGLTLNWRNCLVIARKWSIGEMVPRPTKIRQKPATLEIVGLRSLFTETPLALRLLAIPCAKSFLVRLLKRLAPKDANELEPCH